MKNLLFAFLIGLLIPVFGYCGEHQATAQWDYPDPPTDLAGFLLYREVDGNKTKELSANITVAESFINLEDGNATYSWSGMMKMEDGPNTFRLIAYDLAGQGSPISEPGEYDPVPENEANFILLMFRRK